MNTAQPNPSGDEAGFVQAAAVWRVRHETGLAATEQTEFAAWLAADPRHVAAWRDVNATVFAFERLRADGQAADFVRELGVRRRRRQWRLVGAGVLGIAATVALLLFVRPAAPSAAEGTAPVIVRAERQVLPDGSRVELNRDAAIAVNYTTERREVRLLRGEALFMVEKNPARPFVVVSGPIEVRAVGTTFAVQHGARAVDVLVTEGRVAVAHTVPEADRGETPAAAPKPIFVNAGDQLVMPAVAGAVSADQPRALSAIEIGRRLAWRQPRLQLAGTTLAEAAALLNRENLMQIEIADAELGHLRLTGFFHLDDTRGFVHVLASNYGVRVEHRADGVVVLRQP